MKKWCCWIAVALMSITCAAWQLEIPLSQRPKDENPAPKGKNAVRTLTGHVLDKNDNPVPGAVVYLKNKKTLAMRTYFAQQDGTYRFPQLDRNIDYEIYAETKDGKRSDTKTVSQFDDRNAPMVNLRIDMNK